MDHPVVCVSGRWCRLIPSRFPPIDVYARLGDARIQAAAVQLENLTNPRLASKARLAAEVDAAASSPHRTQNWNHAPFAYGDPEGSFLLDAGRPALELVEVVEEALARSIVRRETFLARTGEPAAELDMRLLRTPINANFADLSTLSGEEVAREGRSIAKLLYDGGSAGALFRDPRHGSARTLAVFDGSVLGRTEQATHYRFTWDGERVRSVYDFDSGQVIDRGRLIPADARSVAA